ncbi:UDP-N-acetylmuramoyl-L-alanine--D-glutamate ligase [Cocleimonas sp. KMM 6892]|uniref:UDP-N-acetylmuramoyl-L-alanine--D-glutamate ligase n=1 Tax=unclassified Cocleimonas TaxID=2639732 RepID=UPI002DBD3005|nr:MULTISPECIES: UDP-N-acetylmuramoyl-L-alanine--D-glutamate ligase [unclassified Cocleimonas]MEB8430609.1 UDP-N-acetylmuramoyl-L-alanine--D-glutamate ligase [Cocleimonas sp. KMM 6892]MEC4716940.1 UDP-N-acetylmuramoyl-L-alanine--D-glutamate ligase [Cocleimonas sp. KMM 6895]MEC4743952.1 UDP-N-acetylmuramoyl-L-alanine--D-glutamate ligase [Cocleimonas sp. KMM 6896]
MNTQQKPSDTVIVGLGTTGLSVARYLASQQRGFTVVDSRANPPCADELITMEQSANQSIAHHFGSFNEALFSQAKQLIVNPGIAVSTLEIAQAKNAGAEIIGDIELFAREANQNQPSVPVVAITGSNGKTTVTTLLDFMAKKAGVNVGTGGNIGTPALELIKDKESELFVLELSSYQLETTPSLQTLAAVILNVSEDHLDRYENDIEQYAQAKALIYKNCEHIIFNREDGYSSDFANKTVSGASSNKSLVSFGLNQPDAGDFGLILDPDSDQEWLAKGDELLMLVSNIKQPGRHNIANSLAALALGEAAGLPMPSMLEALEEFAGMAHRTEWVAEIQNVNWYNDSKGTNVGATLAALSGLPGKTVLIAGGQGKGADFLPLQNVITEKARAVVLMGEDAQKIGKFVDSSIPVIYVNSMEQAVLEANKLANSDENDNVLLSPACASFDMFKNYIERGQKFVRAVNELEKQIAKEVTCR